MIIDLDMRGRRVLVLGGGREALKRIEKMLGEGCHITVLSEGFEPAILEHAKRGSITIEKRRVKDMEASHVISECEPYMAISATDNAGVNQAVTRAAKEAGCLAYCSDDPESSDFANLAVAKSGGIRIAVSTGGQSPIVAKAVLERAKKAITDVDVLTARLHAELRGRVGPNQGDVLRRITSDKTVKRSLEAGDMDEARARAEEMTK